MQIGRRIYYDLLTGEVITDTGEREGNVIETTIDEDLTQLPTLQPYQHNAIGVIQLNYGDDYDNFLTHKPRVDVNSKSLIWDI